MGREVHEREVIQNCGARELAGDNRGDESRGAQFRCQGGAAEDDQSAKRSSNPIPPRCGTQERGGGERRADNEHDENRAKNRPANGEEGGPAYVMQIRAQRRIGRGLYGNASTGGRGQEYPNKKHAGLE